MRMYEVEFNDSRNWSEHEAQSPSMLDHDGCESLCEVGAGNMPYMRYQANFYEDLKSMLFRRSQG